MESVEFSHLNSLLKAPSKEAVDQIFNLAFLHARDVHSKNSHQSLPPQIVKKIEEALQISTRDAIELLLTIAILIDESLFESLEPQQIVDLFPTDFQKNLKQLVAAVITRNMPKWKESLASSQISLPRLMNLDWRIDVKTSSDTFARMSVPSVIVDLEIQEAPKQRDSMGGVNHVSFELTKETLETMLDGLGKIRDQLSSIAQQ